MPPNALAFPQPADPRSTAPPEELSGLGWAVRLLLVTVVAFVVGACIAVAVVVLTL